MYFLPSLMFACCENQLAQYGYISKVLQYNQHQLIDFGQLLYTFSLSLSLSLSLYMCVSIISFIYFPLHVSVHYDTIYSSLIFSTSIKFSHTSLSRKTGIMIHYIVSAVLQNTLTHVIHSWFLI